MAEHLFTVEGVGEFPYDMLRYDSCWPATQRDVPVMTQPALSPGIYDKRSVQLRGVQPPTEARWASFGWTVIPPWGGD